MFKTRAPFFVFTFVAFTALHAQDAAPLPEVTITAPAGLRENQPVDETARPDWTSARRFTTTRVYIQQSPGEIGFEQWLRFRDFRDGTSQARFQEELEFGLPYRMQLDIYENWVVDQDRHADQDETSFELRFALADWGKIPLNPTLYAEYAVVNQAPDTVEFKLLLGQDFGSRVHYGLNLVYEQETWGARSTEFAVTQGISYTLIDSVLSAGAEMEYENETERGSRSNPAQQFLNRPERAGAAIAQHAPRPRRLDRCHRQIAECRRLHHLRRRFRQSRRRERKPLSTSFRPRELNGAIARGKSSLTNSEKFSRK